jgi:2,3-bisphosphoglycerate-dependent phosphoglycerate mutase
MTTTLLVCRHGNTFEDGELPRRVGGRTDLPLTEKGRTQGHAIGRYIKEAGLIPDVVYSSTLQRTIETARCAVESSGYKQPVFPLAIFDEIDYGPDENKTEDDVIARIGAQAIKDWDNQNIVPDGWDIDPEAIIANWRGFAKQITAHDDGEIVMVVTSNGIARFAPYLLAEPHEFFSSHAAKISTGAICILEHDDGVWRIKDWNIRPAL